MGETIEEKFELPDTEDHSKTEIVSSEPKLAKEEMIEVELLVEEKKSILNDTKETVPEIPKLKLQFGKKRKKK